MSKKVVRIWTDVTVDANTKDGVIAAAAAKAIQDGGDAIHWNFKVFFAEDQYKELMAELENITAESAETETHFEPATPTDKQ